MNWVNSTILIILSFSQQKLKEEKEAKRAQLDGRHQFIIEATAGSLSLDVAEVEDAILEGNNVS